MRSPRCRFPMPDHPAPEAVSLFPPLRLGILGGGQLGRMSALAAANLGITTHIYCPELDAPALQVTRLHTRAAYEDESALRLFADAVDVITYEFENVPESTARFLEKLKPVRPSPRVLAISQDRILEKTFLNEAGITTARWAAITQNTDINATLTAWNGDKAVLKTTRLGYDGKGQAKIDRNSPLPLIFDELNPKPLILEEFVPFTAEISVLIARDVFGGMAVYGPVWNEHRNHILARSVVPAPVSDATAAQAVQIARDVATAFDLVGLLAIELFVLEDGRVIANEIAPRPHNSGHWSIDACACSQFDNHVRTVCGLPVGDPAPHSAAEMLNLLGDDVADLSGYLALPGANIHLYGKAEAKPGRKMGHVTLLKPQKPLEQA